jgi:hypothetical protein
MLRGLRPGVRLYEAGSFGESCRRLFTRKQRLMAVARVVRLDGVDQPCLLLTEDGRLPEELVVDVPRSGRLGSHEGRGRVTFRLQPSSLDEPEPLYVEMFDE